MEIDKAIKESDDTRLKTKYNNAIYVIQRAFALYSVEEVALSFNGGKDSTVLLHLLRAGYYLHMSGNGSGEAGTEFPIRTIYFESPTVFTEINSFTYDAALTYKLKMDIIRLDFKSGLEALLKANPIKAIFLGVRIGDPTAGKNNSRELAWMATIHESESHFGLVIQLHLIGSIHDTVPNARLRFNKSNSSEDKFKPAYLLSDGRLERAGRAKKLVSQPTSDIIINGLENEDLHSKSAFLASIIAVGDEILFGTAEDRMGPALCRKIRSIGWSVSHVAVTRNDIDSVADEVERQKSTNDMVFMYGGVGPLPSDVTVAGVAKAFGVRVAPDEEFEEYLRHLIGEKCTGDRNEMAQLPEGITELLHHEKLIVPLIKCQNVIILTATNAAELDQEWDCLIDLIKSNELLVTTEPFVLKRLETSLSDVEAAQSLSELCIEFPDISIGGYRESRKGPLVITFEGKDKTRINDAADALCKKLDHVVFSEIN